MGTGYTRNDTPNNIADGNVINASDLDGEFDAVESAFNESTGHTHDGTAAEGAPITVLGPVQDFIASATEIKPKTTNTLDIGTVSLQFKNMYLEGTAYIDGLGEDILVATDKKVQFRDTALFINSSVDGQLDIDADVELELVAPTVDIDASTAVTIDTATLTITGSANVTGDLDVDNININGNTISSTDTNGNITLAPDGTGVVALSSTDLTFGDNDKAIFGAGSDLQIYHDGSHSYINEAGTGNLKIIGSDISIEGSGETFATFADDGAVTLYHDNAVKFATTATGVDVTGTLVSDGLTVSGDAVFTPDNDGVRITGANYATLRLEENDTTDLNTTMFNSGGKFSIYTSSDDRASATERLTLDHSNGSVGIGGSETTVFNGTGGDMKFVAIGDDSTTTITNNSDAGIAIVNTNQTAGNLAGLHFARADTDNTPNYAGASIVAQFPEAQVTGQYPKGDLAFLTSTATNSAPSEKMRLTAAGHVGIGVTPASLLHIKGQAPVLTLQDTDTSGTTNIEFQDSAATVDAKISVGNSTQFMAFETAGTERMRIDSSGLVGVNVTSLSKRLSVGVPLADTDGLALVYSGDPKGGILLNPASGEVRMGAINSSGTYFPTLYANNSERMRIDSSGNVGIGTSSPSRLLEVNGSAAFINIDSGANNNQRGIEFDYGGSQINGSLINFGGTGETALSGGESGSSGYFLTFKTNGSERMRITSAGGVAIGTSSPISGVMLDIRPTSTTRIMNTRSFNTGLQYHHAFENNSGSLVGSIGVSTTATAFNTSSDYRLKENVVADWDATTRLKQLNPVRFNFIADADTTVDGFLAHEVQDIVPEAISGTKDGMMDEEYEVSAATGDIYTPATEAVLDEDGNEVTPAVAEVIHSTDVERPEELAEGQQWRETTAAVMGTRSVPDYQGIDQSKLTPLLTKALIEAVEKIEQLETRLAALEAN